MAEAWQYCDGDQDFVAEQGGDICNYIVVDNSVNNINGSTHISEIPGGIHIKRYVNWVPFQGRAWWDSDIYVTTIQSSAPPDVKAHYCKGNQGAPQERASMTVICKRSGIPQGWAPLYQWTESSCDRPGQHSSNNAWYAIRLADFKSGEELEVCPFYTPPADWEIRGVVSGDDRCGASAPGEASHLRLIRKR